MATEVLSKEMVCAILEDHINFHESQGNNFTQNVLITLRNNFIRIEGPMMSDCSECEYFLQSKKSKEENTNG